MKLLFSSSVEENLAETNEAELYQEMTEKCLESMANFQRMGSNWRFVSVIQLGIHVVDFDPLNENEDDECFKWAVTRALNPI